MFNLKLIEVVIILMFSSGIFAGIYLAVRLARRPSTPREGN
jgi:hypothetical protein